MAATRATLPDMKERWIPVASPSLTGNEKAYVLDCLESNCISSIGEYVARLKPLPMEPRASVKATSKAQTFTQRVHAVTARAIRFSTLDAICVALSCQPGDILRFEPAQDERERPPARKRSARR